MQDTKNITTVQRQEEENQIEPERERVLSREESLSKEWWFSLSRGDPEYSNWNCCGLTVRSECVGA